MNGNDWIDRVMIVYQYPYYHLTGIYFSGDLSTPVKVVGGIFGLI